MTPLVEGDRVLIVGAHPWSGEVGEVVGKWATPDLDWIVALDNGIHVGASEVFHLRKVEAAEVAL